MNVAVKSLKSAAPGPYLGYALQPVRLCFHLLTSPAGAKVSLEHLDDIAVHYHDGSVLLEQTKSALKQNPLSDWSDELWKAIAHWLDGIASGQLASDKSSFQLYVTPPHHGRWAQALSDAATEAEVEALFTMVQAEHKKLKKPKGCESNLQRFLTASPEIRNALVLRFHVLCSEVDPVNALRNLIKTSVGPELVDDLCHAAIGMAKEQADRLIRDGKASLIDADAFKRNFIAFVRKNNIPGLLTSLTPIPPNAEVQAVLSMRPTFIRQLEIIETSEQDHLRAVSDFLRASADKSAWAEQGLIFEGSLTEWDDFLVRRHSLISGEVFELHADKDAAFRGRMAYRQCAQVNAPLEGRAVPSHFVPGSFNALADVMRVGWHPDYQTLLSEVSE
jgi:C-terminal domain 7 of the ABC-three component (ABC-3C) systems